MESVLWAVVLYFIVKRWLRKNPDALKAILSAKTTAARPHTEPKRAAAQPSRVTSTSHTEAKLPKKREKQFQEL